MNKNNQRVNFNTDNDYQFDNPLLVQSLHSIPQNNSGNTNANLNKNTKTTNSRNSLGNNSNGYHQNGNMSSFSNQHRSTNDMGQSGYPYANNTSMSHHQNHDQFNHSQLDSYRNKNGSTNDTSSLHQHHFQPQANHIEHNHNNETHMSDYQNQNHYNPSRSESYGYNSNSIDRNSLHHSQHQTQATVNINDTRMSNHQNHYNQHNMPQINSATHSNHNDNHSIQYHQNQNHEHPQMEDSNSYEASLLQFSSINSNEQSRHSSRYDQNNTVTSIDPRPKSKYHHKNQKNPQQKQLHSLRSRPSKHANSSEKVAAEHAPRPRLEKEDYIVRSSLNLYMNMSKKVRKQLNGGSSDSQAGKGANMFPPISNNNSRSRNVAAGGRNLKTDSSPLLISNSQLTVKLLEHGLGEMSERELIINRMDEFYEQLMRTSQKHAEFENQTVEHGSNSRLDNGTVMSGSQEPVYDESVGEVTLDEVDEAVRHMKESAHKTLNDEVTFEILKTAKSLTQTLSQLCTYWLRTSSVTPGLSKSPVLMVYSNKRDARPSKDQPPQPVNQGPISILHLAHRILSRILIGRLSDELDTNMAKGSMPNSAYLQTVNQLVEKCNEYGLPLYICFLHFENELNHHETHALVNGLADENADSSNAQMIKKVSREIEQRTSLNAKWAIQNQPRQFQSPARLSDRQHEQQQVVLHKPPRGNKNKKDVVGLAANENDPTSKLLATALKTVWKKFDLSQRGIPIAVGETHFYLNHLRKSEIVATDFEELAEMTNELVAESVKIGLKIDLGKSKWLSNRNDDNVKSIVIEQCGLIAKSPNYVFLGQTVSLTSVDNEEEIKRRIMAGWIAFNKLKGNVYIIRVLRKKKNKKLVF
jgi:hypothetical protein